MVDVRAAAAVALGAALGGFARYLVTVIVVAKAGGSGAPVATVAINVIGSFAIGVLAASLERGFAPSPELRHFLIPGILGGFTTFSTFSLESIALVSAGASVAAAAYIVASVGGGLCAAALGMWVARLLAAAS